MKKRFAPFCVGPVLAGLVLFSANLPAQIAITALGTAITENFDSIGATATASLPADWLMTAAGNTAVSWADPTNLTATTLQASSGSPTGGGRYNWGQSPTDRAIGFMTSGSYASPNSILAHFSNNTGSAIDQLSVSFDYERYRINTAPAAVSFLYSTDGATWIAAPGGDSGAFSTGASAYGFGTLVSSVPASVTLSALNLGPGADFYLRWIFATNGSNSQGLGLDNFSLTASAVPEPSTWAAIAGVTALLGAIWQRRRQRRVPAADP
jgi:hypothetical protein